MQRREFMKAIAGSVASWPLAARAQQQLPVIGILSSRSRATDALLIPVISGTAWRDCPLLPP